VSRVLLSQADITELEAEAVYRAALSGWVTSLGPEVDAFERELAARVGVHAALALSSGTAALHLGLLGVGVRPGQLVLVSSMTFAASANAISYVGATPVFVDSLGDGNLDPDLLVHAVDTLLAEGADVGAVMSVDLLGRCVDYDHLEPALASRGIPLVVDAAESLGAAVGGRAAGSFGQVAAVSFNGNKVMTTSGGGMLLSDDAELIDRARYLSTQARQPTPWYEHTEIGYNYRLSNVLAALGRAQLGRLDAMIARRRSIRDRYAAVLASVGGARLLHDCGALGAAGRDDLADNCWLTALVLDDTHSLDADTLVALLMGDDIEGRHLWKPMHLQPVFADHRAFATGVSERLFARGVALPSGSALRDEEVERVCAALTTHLGRA
jgi:dTDP-4-amino-4,6-dideoxygalactose transaminase